MAIANACIVSESISIDQQTNRFSAFNALEYVTVRQSEADRGAQYTALRHVASVLWLRDEPDVPEQKLLRICVILPDGKRLEMAAQNLILDNFPSCRTIVGVESFPICSKPGRVRYVFQLRDKESASDDWETAHTYCIELTFIDDITNAIL